MAAIEQLKDRADSLREKIQDRGLAARPTESPELVTAEAWYTVVWTNQIGEGLFFTVFWINSSGTIMQGSQFIQDGGRSTFNLDPCDTVQAYVTQMMDGQGNVVFVFPPDGVITPAIAQQLQPGHPCVDYWTIYPVGVGIG